MPSAVKQISKDKGKYRVCNHGLKGSGLQHNKITTRGKHIMWKNMNAIGIETHNNETNAKYDRRVVTLGHSRHLYGGISRC
jgi:hypothetical protein